MKTSFIASLTLRAIVPSALAFLLAVPADAYALSPKDEHLVSPDAMQKQMIKSASDRQKNIETITGFLTRLSQ